MGWKVVPSGAYTTHPYLKPEIHLAIGVKYALACLALDRLVFNKAHVFNFF